MVEARPFIGDSHKKKQSSCSKASQLFENTSYAVNLLAEGEEGATTLMGNTSRRGEPSYRFLNRQ